MMEGYYFRLISKQEPRVGEDNAGLRIYDSSIRSYSYNECKMVYFLYCEDPLS